MFQALIVFLFTSLMACASPTKATDSHHVESPAPKTKSKKSKSKKSQTEVKPDADLQAVEAKYAAAKSMSMDVKKSLILSLLERTDVYEGRFFLSGKEKLRLEFEKPVKSVAVLNGREFWVIEYPPKDVDDKVRVLKSSLGEKSQSQVLVTSLLGRGNLQESFEVESKTKKDGRLNFKLKPTVEMADVKNLQVTVDEDQKLITEVSYEDDLENKTKFEFSRIKFDTEVPDKLFIYAPPKDAEVSHL